MKHTHKTQPGFAPLFVLLIAGIVGAGTTAVVATKQQDIRHNNKNEARLFNPDTGKNYNYKKGLENKDMKNDSVLKIEGTLEKVGLVYQLTHKDVVYTLIPATGMILDEYMNKTVKVTGFMVSGQTNQLSVVSIKLIEESEQVGENSVESTIQSLDADNRGEDKKENGEPKSNKVKPSPNGSQNANNKIR